MKIISTTPYGDVDYGPEAGVIVVAHLDDGEIPVSIWEYFVANYQDDWQEYLVSSTEGDETTVKLFTKWGDGHKSEVKR